MEPLEFANRWHLSWQDLALICGRSVSQINHWYSGKSDRWPDEQDKKLVELANFVWTAMDAEPQYLRDLREIYFRMKQNKDK